MMAPSAKKKTPVESGCPQCSTGFDEVPLCCPRCGHELRQLFDGEGRLNAEALEDYREARQKLVRSTWSVALIWAFIWAAVLVFFVPWS